MGLLRRGQWSTEGRDRGTLMRHDVGGGSVQRGHRVARPLAFAFAASLAPAACALGMRHAPGAACLVAPCGLALRVLACCARARRAAIALAAIAATAQQHLCTAARAHEQAGGMVDQLPGSSGSLPRTSPLRAAPRCCERARPVRNTLALHPLRRVVGHGVRNEAARPTAAAVPAYDSGMPRVLPHSQPILPEDRGRHDAPPRSRPPCWAACCATHPTRTITAKPPPRRRSRKRHLTADEQKRLLTAE